MSLYHLTESMCLFFSVYFIMKDRHVPVISHSSSISSVNIHHWYYTPSCSHYNHPNSAILALFSFTYIQYVSTVSSTPPWRVGACTESRMLILLVCEVWSVTLQTTRWRSESGCVCSLRQFFVLFSPTSERLTPASRILTLLREDMKRNTLESNRAKRQTERASKCDRFISCNIELITWNT